MKKIKYYVIHFFMNIGMLAERIWDETKKFVWWLFAPNAYADLAEAYRGLKSGYQELWDTWDYEDRINTETIERLEVENMMLRRRIEELEALTK